MTDTSENEEPTSVEQPARDPLRRLAAMACGKSRADIERLIRLAQQKARHEKRALTFGDLEQVLTQGNPNQDPDLRYAMAVHEAGPAVVRLALSPGTIKSISIDAPWSERLMSSRSLDGVSERSSSKWLTRYEDNGLV